MTDNEKRLRRWRDQKREEVRQAGGKFFMDFPDAWFEPVHYGCENGHLSTRYLKSEIQGNVCLSCQKHIYLIPAIEEEELEKIVKGIPTLTEIEDYGDLIPLKRFLECVESGGFIDYDGHGYWATKRGYAKGRIKPSQIKNKAITPPQWATHVNWFNR